MEKKELFKYIDDPDQVKIGTAVSHGAYKAWEKALKQMKPAEVIEEVKKAGVRGRGGAGFPAGVKWGFIPKDSPKPKYLICNADESEPGTCKDRELMERDPHATVEGMAIASYAIGCHLAFIYVRGEFVKSYRTMEKAIDEAREKGYLGKNIFGTGYDLDIIVHTGGGAYIEGDVNTDGGNFVGQGQTGSPEHS